MYVCKVKIHPPLNGNTMKKLILFASLAFIFSTCSTDLDILDDWKETMVVYSLLDTTQAKQYVRIEKAFLGADNALSMAQNYDSINYLNNLDVWLKEIDANGNLVMAYQLSPDTLLNKEAGIFAFPEQVVYSMPTANSLPWNSAHKYKIQITNLSSGVTVSATTSLVTDFVFSRPQGTNIDIRHLTNNSKIVLEWNGSPNARIYQVVGRFHYFERDINNVIVRKTTKEWQIQTVKTTVSNATTLQHIEIDPNAFYKFLSNNLVSDPNVTARESDSIEFAIYAGGDELNTYMEINAPSTSLVQEKPLYTNIENGLGLFSARYEKVSTRFNLTTLTKDTLAKGQFSCHLQFLDHNETILNNADLPPGCQ
ncbi:hypothetical protein BH09BAC5_BH09BAC5_23510 [soil metagenome]